MSFENESDLENLSVEELRLVFCQLFNEVALRKQVADEYLRMEAMLRKVESLLFKPKV